MKRLLIIVLCLGVSGCPTAWQKLRDNPIVAISDFLNGARTALGLADAAMAVWGVVNPEGAAAARPQYEAIKGSVFGGMDLAQTALETARMGQTGTLNLETATTQARTAIGQLHNFIAGLGGSGPGRASGPEMERALRATERMSQWR